MKNTGYECGKYYEEPELQGRPSLAEVLCPECWEILMQDTSAHGKLILNRYVSLAATGFDA